MSLTALKIALDQRHADWGVRLRHEALQELREAGLCSMASALTRELAALPDEHSDPCQAVARYLRLEIMPAAADGPLVLIHGEGGFMTALNVTTGERAWTANTVPAGGCQPLIAQDRAVVNLLDGRLCCLDMTGGAERWLAEACERRWNGTMAAGEGRVVACDESGALGCFDLQSGRRLWLTPVGVPFKTMFPTIADGRILFGTRGDGLYCLEADECP